MRRWSAATTLKLGLEKTYRWIENRVRDES